MLGRCAECRFNDPHQGLRVKWFLDDLAAKRLHLVSMAPHELLVRCCHHCRDRGRSGISPEFLEEHPSRERAFNVKIKDQKIWMFTTNSLAGDFCIVDTIRLVAVHPEQVRDELMCVMII